MDLSCKTNITSDVVGECSPEDPRLNCFPSSAIHAPLDTKESQVSTVESNSSTRQLPFSHRIFKLDTEELLLAVIAGYFVPRHGHESQDQDMECRGDMALESTRG